MPVRSSPDFDAVHARLKSILKELEAGSLQARLDQSGDYVLIGPPTERSRGKEVWFGAVQKRKNYVSYHLMPVYAFPDLLEGVSPRLKKRMHGKSCFNFKEVDEPLFQELADLTRAGYERFTRENLIV